MSRNILLSNKDLKHFLIFCHQNVKIEFLKHVRFVASSLRLWAKGLDQAFHCLGSCSYTERIKVIFIVTCRPKLKINVIYVKWSHVNVNFEREKTKTIKSYKIIVETRVRFLRSSEETQSWRCLLVHRHRGGLTRQKVIGVDTESKSRIPCGGFTAHELNWTELTCKNSTHLHDAFIGYTTHDD